MILVVSILVFVNGCDGKGGVSGEKDSESPRNFKENPLTEKDMEELQVLIKKEAARQKEEKRLAQAKYDKIFNACFLDRSSNVDMQVSSIEKAVKETCKSIAEDPSWFESLQYD